LETPLAQVQDYSWEQLQALAWPTGEQLLTVSEAVAQVQDLVQLLIIDVKTSADVSRVSVEMLAEPVCKAAVMCWVLAMFASRGFARSHFASSVAAQAEPCQSQSLSMTYGVVCHCHMHMHFKFGVWQKYKRYDHLHRRHMHMRFRNWPAPLARHRLRKQMLSWQRCMSCERPTTR
jgi:hypothetical protein